MNQAASKIDMRLHRRQLLIGPEPVQVYDDWQTRQLDAALWLSYCPALPVATNLDADGVRWCLAGLAVQSADDRPAPIDDLATTPTTDVPALTHDWAGRWVLFNNDRLYMDAAGTLGCYYGKHEESLWLSSSPALVARQLQLGPAEVPKLDKPLYNAWSPPPVTRTRRIARLIASQAIRLSDGDMAYRPLVPRMDRSVGPDKAAERFAQRLTTTVANLRSLDMPIWLGLTGGRDSRTVLGLCSSEKLPIRAFTRDATRMSIADHVLPPRLAAMCGVEHRFVRGKRVTKRRTDLALRHSLCEVMAHDMMPLLAGTRDELDGVMIGGHGFETFSEPNFPDQPDHLDRDLWHLAEQILRDNFFNPADWPRAHQGLHDWLVWTKDHPDPNLDWRDRYNIEQGNGAWSAQKDLVYDLNRVSRFPLMNCAWNHALLLSLPAESRSGTAIHTRILQDTVPDLLKPPFNPKNRAFSIPTILRAKSYRLPGFLWRYLDIRLYRYLGDRRNRKADKRR